MPDTESLKSNWKCIHENILSGKIVSAFAVGAGGAAEGLCKMAFGNAFGIDVKVDEDVYEILTAPNDFSTVRENLEKQGFTFLSADVQKIPQNTVAVTDPDTVLKIQKMLDLLEENDDVQNVYHNADLPDEEEDE